MTETRNRLSESDRALLHEARLAKERGDAVWNFVTSHLRHIYALSDDQIVATDGEIITPHAASESGTEEAAA